MPFAAAGMFHAILGAPRTGLTCRPHGFVPEPGGGAEWPPSSPRLELTPLQHSKHLFQCILRSLRLLPTIQHAKYNANVALYSVVHGIGKTLR